MLTATPGPLKNTEDAISYGERCTRGAFAFMAGRRAQLAIQFASLPLCDTKSEVATQMQLLREAMDAAPEKVRTWFASIINKLEGQK